MLSTRTAVEKTYWEFAAERQDVFLKRVRGEEPPWTDDSILRTYKFCNVFRASDRVSQYLISRVIYSGVDWTPEDVLFRIILFRLFSRIETWVGLEQRVGEISYRTFDSEVYGSALADLNRLGPIYTSAFILAPSTAFGRLRKFQAHLALADHVIRAGVAKKLARSKSFRSIYDSLNEFPMIGPFMGYQLAIDINYSELIDFSENEFAVAGPGALRGIEKVYSDTGGHSAEYLILHMVDIQRRATEGFGISFKNLFGREMHAVDCQNWFCETDKYCRVAFPELKSGRVRIKSRFDKPRRSFRLFYPPKWGINANLPLEVVDLRPVD